MRVRELSLRNYRVFERVDLELPARVIGIFGPNGSGKTSLVTAIRFALYGADRTPKDLIRTQGILTDCEVRLVFEHGGQQYEVRRTIRGKNHTPRAELLVGDLQLALGAREVTGEIQRLLHMDQQVFRASVFAEQKQLDAFSDIRKGERKTMVLRLLGIKPVEDAITAARKESRGLAKDAERLGTSLPDVTEEEVKLATATELRDKAVKRAEEAAEDLRRASAAFEKAGEVFDSSEETRRRVEQLSAVRAQAQEAAEDAATRHEELHARIEQLAESLAALPSLEDELAGLSGARDMLEMATRCVDAATALKTAERALKALPGADPEGALVELEAATTELRAAEKTAAKAEAALEHARARLADAEEALERAGELDSSEPCPTCGQPLGDSFADVVAHRRTEVASLRKEVAAAQKLAGETDAALRTAEKRHETAEEAGTAAQRAFHQRDGLERKVAEERVRVEELGRPFDGTPPDLDKLAARARRAEELDRQVTELTTDRKHLDQDRRDLAAAAADRDRTVGKVAELDGQIAALAFDSEVHARLKAERHQAGDDLDRARRDEGDAADELAKAEREAVAAAAGLEKVREMAAAIEESREEARYADRVSVLLGGFRDHLVGRIGPELSREAEALFRELTSHEYEDLSISEDDLSIQIADGGAYHPIERFSGSETDLANLALRVAISTHLSRMSGADIGMMVLDEVLASLDAERKDLLVQAMGRLANRFHQLFVITHAEQVKDQFPASIEVRKVGRRRSEAVLI